LYIITTTTRSNKTNKTKGTLTAERTVLIRVLPSTKVYLVFASIDVFTKCHKIKTFPHNLQMSKSIDVNID